MVANTSDSQIEGRQNETIEALARATDMPLAIVKEIYVTQHKAIEKDARIKTYVPVLTSSRVKNILHQRKLQQQQALQDTAA